MKKIISVILMVGLISATFVGCNTKEKPKEGFDTSKDITVVSREDGSGTRGAFIELLGILEKDTNGNKTDKTTKEAVIASKTDIMLTNISGDDYGIGYISLGSLKDSVKALKIDGVEATPENVKSGKYKVARPFIIATKGETAGLKKDFIDFIMSKEGQEIVSKSYISVSDDAKAYAGDKPSGKLVIAGSSSVTPIMVKLKEAYEVINPDADIQIQEQDSTAGMNGTIDGTCDIGMASREMKDSEKEQLTGISIAIDGIAVIVNPNNTTDDMTTEQVKNIFTGTITKWSLK